MCRISSSGILRWYFLWIYKMMHSLIVLQLCYLLWRGPFFFYEIFKSYLMFKLWIGENVMWCVYIKDFHVKKLIFTWVIKQRGGTSEFLFPKIFHHFTCEQVIKSDCIIGSSSLSLSLFSFLGEFLNKIRCILIF